MLVNSTIEAQENCVDDDRKYINSQVSIFQNQDYAKLSTSNVKSSDPSRNTEALKILRRTVVDFKKNSPSDLDAYQYKSYDKFSIDIHPDSVIQYRNSLLKDAVFLKRSSHKFSSKRLMLNNKLLVWERLQEIEYQKGKGEKIIVLDNKLSGTNVPIMEMFVMQNNRNKIPDLLEEKERKLHHFELIDSIQLDKRLTYVIHYQYKDLNKKSKRKNYNGKIYIDADTFGIRRLDYFADQRGTSFYRANWVYLFGKWFLETEDLTLKIYRAKTDGKKKKFGVYSFINTRYFDFKENSEKNFKGYTYEVKHTEGKLIDSLRNFPLLEREKSSYTALNQLKGKYKFDKKIHFVNGLIAGMIRIGKLDFDPLELINFNDYEGLRVGALVKTNYLLNKYISPDLQLAYGSRDKKWKYRFGVDIRTRLDKNALFRASYFNTIGTSGDFSRKFWNFKMRTMNYGNNFSNSKYFSSEGFSVSYLEDITNCLTVALELKGSKESALFNYDFSGQGKNFKNLSSHFTFKYSPNTTNVMTYDGKSIVDQGYPELYFNWEQGYRNFGGKLSYGRFDLLFIQQSKSIIGNTAVKLYGGLVTGKTPIWHLYTVNGLASSTESLNFSVTSFLGFATLPGGEFYTDRFAGVYLSHELPWYFRFIGKSTSSIDVVYRGNIGNLKNNKGYHYPIKTLDRLYQEIGLEWNKVFSSPFNLGFFYRVGYYNTPSFMNNFGVQLKLDLLKF